MSKIVFIIVVAIIVAGAIYYEKRRSDGMSAAARRLGFDYQAGQQALPPELDAAGFDLFTQGAPNIRHRLWGSRDGRRMVLFDYTYSASSAAEGRREQPVADDYNGIEDRAQTVLWVRLQKPLPDFDLSPSRLHRRTVAERFGLNRVTLDGEAEFNQSRILLARNAERVRELFAQPLLSYLQRHPRIVVEARGENLLLYRFEQLSEPTAVITFLEEAEELLQLLQK
ncbi:MAG: hypothetical protein KDI68_02860 [Gammaproteobacteria bacterium]|nr:hypothetical protein [Gammaproteobacteria bacterium]